MTFSVCPFLRLAAVCGGALLCSSCLPMLGTGQMLAGSSLADGLTICVLAFPLIGSQIIIGNFFQAIGKARLAIFLSLTRQMLFLLPFLLVLPRFWGQDGVWASLPLADVLSFIVTLLFIRRFLKYYRLKNRHYLDHSTAEA